jgi:hypothetical protein
MRHPDAPTMTCSICCRFDPSAAHVSSAIGEAASTSGLQDKAAVDAFMANSAAMAELSQRLRAPNAQHTLARWAPAPALLEAVTVAGAFLSLQSESFGLQGLGCVSAVMHVIESVVHVFIVAQRVQPQDLDHVHTHFGCYASHPVVIVALFANICHTLWHSFCS